MPSPPNSRASCIGRPAPKSSGPNRWKVWLVLCAKANQNSSWWSLSASQPTTQLIAGRFCQTTRLETWKESEVVHRRFPMLRCNNGLPLLTVFGQGCLQHISSFFLSKHCSAYFGAMPTITISHPSFICAWKQLMRNDKGGVNDI